MGAETPFRDNSCYVVQDFVLTERAGIIHLRVCVISRGVVEQH